MKSKKSKVKQAETILSVLSCSNKLINNSNIYCLEVGGCIKIGVMN